MESVYVPGTRQERVDIEKPAIDLYDLSKKIQYHVTRQEFEIANDLLQGSLLRPFSGNEENVRTGLNCLSFCLSSRIPPTNC